MFGFRFYNEIFYQAFKKDYEKFKEKIEYLDLRLASIINQGFDDCGSLEAILKVNSHEIRYGILCTVFLNLFYKY